MGSGRAARPSGTQTKLAVDIGPLAALMADQLATEFFETVVIETKAELNTAI
jgi:hypothetical protein